MTTLLPVPATTHQPDDAHPAQPVPAAWPARSTVPPQPRTLAEERERACLEGWRRTGTLAPGARLTGECRREVARDLLAHYRANPNAQTIDEAR